MLEIRKLVWAFLSLLILAALPGHTAFADPPAPEIPPGFKLILSSTGVQLYQKDYRKGNPDFVQMVDLSQGAMVKLLHGEITDPGKDKGAYGGNDPKIWPRTLQDYWKEFSVEHSTAFCVTNGQFFYMRENPTRLPFPLKKDGVILSTGYGKQEYPGQKLILEIWPNRADINELTKEALYSSSAPDIIAGLAEDARKSPDKYVARTFVGVSDRDRDGLYETILIFNTKTAQQVDAANVLRSFGAEKLMMLDGGGSTQLTCKNTPFISSERLIPQALGVAAAVIPSSTLVSQPNWPVILVGEDPGFKILLQNTGTEPWPAGRYQLVAEVLPSGEVARLPLNSEIPPGGKAFFTWAAAPFNQWGVYTIQWYLAQGSRRFPGEPGIFHAIVLPQELADQSPDFREKLAQWKEAQSADIAPLAVNWVQERLQVGAKNGLQKPTPQQALAYQMVDLHAILWLPLVIFPFSLLLMLYLLRIRSHF